MAMCIQILMREQARSLRGSDNAHREIVLRARKRGGELAVGYHISQPPREVAGSCKELQEQLPDDIIIGIN